MSGAAPAVAVARERVPEEPAAVVLAAMSLFRDLRIPVAMADEVQGSLLSAPLDANGTWGGGAMAEKVRCDGGVPPNAQLTLSVSARPAGETTEVSVASQPYVYEGGERRAEAAPCRLREEYGARLLQEIAARAERR